MAQGGEGRCCPGSEHADVITAHSPAFLQLSYVIIFLIMLYQH